MFKEFVFTTLHMHTFFQLTRGESGTGGHRAPRPPLASPSERNSESYGDKQSAEYICVLVPVK